MSGKIKNTVRIGIRYIVTAFLIVAITQILIYFNIFGNSFVEQIVVTLFSLIISSALLAVGTTKSAKSTKGR